MKYFLYALALLLIGLKLTGLIAASWWLVLLPLYGGAAVFLPIFLLLLGIRWAYLQRMTPEQRFAYKNRKELLNLLEKYSVLLGRKGK